MADPEKSKDNVIDLDFFQRPQANGRRPQKLNFADLMTFKNIVIALGVATFLIFLGSAVSARIAFLFAALLGLLALVLFEMSSRRKWERDVVLQMQKISTDYDRVVRETARNRNDLHGLKKALSEAGQLAKSYARPTENESVEHRMFRSIAHQLAKIGTTPQDEEEEGADEIAGFDVSALTAEKPKGPPDDGVGIRLSDQQVLKLVNLAVEQDKIDLFMQPIVALPQRKLRFYEMFSRIRIKADTYLPAERYIEVAMEQDLVPVIDNLLLLRGLQMIRDTEDENYNYSFFCNITSLTLNDPKFMGDLVEFITENRTLAPRLIFELGQRDLSTMSADILPILGGLASLGCRFSMDQVKSLSFDFAHLEARYIRFIKIDIGLILPEFKEIGGLSRMKRMKQELDRRGIDLIVEKIEGDKQLVELFEVEIDYGQGYLFGKPQRYDQI